MSLFELYLALCPHIIAGIVGYLTVGLAQNTEGIPKLFGSLCVVVVGFLMLISIIGIHAGFQGTYNWLPNRLERPSDEMQRIFVTAVVFVVLFGIGALLALNPRSFLRRVANRI